MYNDLGVHWASAVPGFIALACFPFPIFFYKYGEAIRRRCKYSAEAARLVDSLKSDLERQRSRASVANSQKAQEAGGVLDAEDGDGDEDRDRERRVSITSA